MKMFEKGKTTVEKGRNNYEELRNIWTYLQNYAKSRKIHEQGRTIVETVGTNTGTGMNYRPLVLISYL